MPEIFALRVPFVDLEQQGDAARIGMWIFLATEVMFFGVLFTAFGVYHHLYEDAFAAASRRMDFWLGTANTAILLISSLTMALSVQAAKEGQRRPLVRWLLLTISLGTVFLACKGIEYNHHIKDHLWPGVAFAFDPLFFRPAELFFYLYFAMTGLHALHMLIGIVVLSVLAVKGGAGKYSAAYHTPVELAGLYWHFVDLIWLFLFPLFYLIGGH